MKDRDLNNAVELIVKGKTTKEEIKKWLGSPEETEETFVYLNGDKVFKVMFDSKGIVKGHEETFKNTITREP